MREPVRSAAAGLLLLACAAGPTSACAPGAPPDGETSAGTTGAPSSPDEAVLAEVIENVFTGSAPDRGYEDVRSFVVVVDGEPVVERYSGATAQTGHNTASVTKSVMSILLGIALADGHLTSVDQTLAELLPGYAPDMSAEIVGITLEQLLTHTSGLPRRLPQVRPDGDVVATILERGLQETPGERFLYSDSGTHLLSALLTEATGLSAMQFASRHLFEPLGACPGPVEPVIREGNEPIYEGAACAWPADPQGRNLGGAGLKLSTADLVKIGRLMLSGGRWDGEQVVPADWVVTSTAAHAAADGPVRLAPSYGYLWWVTTAGDHSAYAAIGYGGQLVEVVPDLDLVVVAQSTVPDFPRMDGVLLLSLVEREVVPAVGP